MRCLFFKVFCLFLLLTFGLPANGATKVDDTLKISKVDTVTLENVLRMKVGDKFPDIYFYNLAGQKFGPDSVFRSKPVMFITGSYSCPIFRYNSKKIYRKMKKRSKKYDIYFIYLAEAHPLVGSPYGSKRDSSRQNKRDKIFVEQQKYMTQRIEIAKKTKTDFNVFSKVLVDNENNGFYEKINGSPNTFCIFSKNKILVKQRVWFDYKGKIKAKKRRINPPAITMNK